MKLKNWGYEKYSTSADRNISVAKTIKRKRDEGKSTAFFHLGSKIQLSKIECFKRRKTTDGVEEVSPSAGNSCLVFAKITHRFLQVNRNSCKHYASHCSL
jgi:hypothetical protein